MFKNRKDAGQKLAKALEDYKQTDLTDLVVLGIPRGGVELAYYIAQYLHAPMSLIVVRKLPYPDNPEAGFGAVAEDGSTYFVDRSNNLLPKHLVNKIINQQKQEIKRRIEVLRNSKPLIDIFGKTVILVDDGIAMGSTMRAAIALCKNKNASKIIVASPVSSPSIEQKLKTIVDDVVILEKPSNFHAVAQVYEQWYDVSDKEVLDFLQK